MKPFALEHAPLSGSNLIEAAAGTGKTYSIEGLCLRLVLERQIPIEQILVVTFTQAATAELRERIYRRLTVARDEACGRPGPSGPGMIPDGLAPERAALLLRRALMDFDQAPIYTIHGFCQRVLHEHAFETGNTFDVELAPDQTGLIQEIADDFWRRNVSEAPAEFIAFALEKLRGPERFAGLLARLKTPSIRIVPREKDGRLEALPGYRETIDGLRRDWPSARAAVCACLGDPALDGRAYGVLKPAGPGTASTRRESTVAALAAAMDTFLNAAAPAFPPFEGLEKFSADFLEAKTRKGRTTPRHPFFESCRGLRAAAAALEEEMHRCLRQLKVAAVDFARGELPRRKSERNTQGFDDLLLQVARALEAEQGGALAEAVRRKYRAVLVDEFQDTDDLQYVIFSRIFEGEERILFLIGDPKQAIYGFRGADIFSYLKAAREASNTYTLGVNRRAVPGLVTAVNAIFSHSPRPFLFPEIAFRPATAARGDSKARSAPFVVWHLDSRRLRQDGKPVTKPEAEALIARAVAGEIQRLTAAQTPAGDIAVLVRTNRQARICKRQLDRAGVPAVVCSAGNLFDSAEAEEMERLLSAVAAPGDATRLKAALATDAMGFSALELASAEAESGRFDAQFNRFRDYFRIWREEGFMPMFGRLLAEAQVRPRLLSFPDGERRLTNLLHLGEVLHQSAVALGLGASELLKWLVDQRHPDRPRLEEHQLRLESDEAAVKIVTIHKSKGLEYPVVFCPFAWSGSLVRGDEHLFHDPAAELRLTLDVGGGASSRHLAEDEALSENLRLLYVALTRARERCYLVWGRINQADTSALAYLLHFAPGEPAAGTAGRGVVERLPGALASMDDEAIRAALERLASRSEGAVAIRPLPEPAAPAAPPPAGSRPRLYGRLFAGAIDRSWKTASYSMLTGAAAGAAEADGRDAMDIRPAGAGPGPEHPKPDPGKGLAGFPRGSGAGVFFHALLERVDFSRVGGPETGALIERTLAEFGYGGEWRAAIARMLVEVAGAAFLPAAPGFCLAELGEGERLNEMEFHYPLRRLEPGTLARVFSESGGGGGRSGFRDRIERLSFAPAQGHMRGFIDMVFRHGSRWYLLDWKSNHLGDDTDDYGADRLEKVMLEDLYILQYHIYALALHLYLRLRQPGYRYEEHFGGAAYVFIRGIDGLRGPGHGVFFDRPGLRLIDSLGETLIPNYLK
jgi:exodeoxyribonuclease V beta subunit